MIYVNCDGSITGGNPGGRGYTGFVVKDHAGQLIYQHSDDLGVHAHMSNNVAEYGAVLSALLWLSKQGMTQEEVMVMSDSQLVVRQLEGRWQCAHPVLRRIKLRIETVAQAFTRVAYLWVPREHNREADAMSKSLQ